MKLNQTTSLPKPVLTIDVAVPENAANAICFHLGGDIMLRIAPDGFYVRGVKLDQNELEARQVYESFTEWLAWAQLNR